MISYKRFIAAIDSGGSNDPGFGKDETLVATGGRNWEGESKEESPLQIDDVLARVQDQCWARGIRMKQFFQDFDRLRHGHVSAGKFQGALSNIGIMLRPSELEALTQH